MDEASDWKGGRLQPRALSIQPEQTIVSVLTFTMSRMPLRQLAVLG